MRKKSIVIPDDRDFEINEWKRIHNVHFSTPEHVSKSDFAEFHGTRDLGTKLHIPPAGEPRDAMNAREAKRDQKIRCQKLRNERAAEAS